MDLWEALQFRVVQGTPSLQKHKKIIINNQQYKVAKHLDDGKTGACYNATDKQLHIRFELSHEAIEIKTK